MSEGQAASGGTEGGSGNADSGANGANDSATEKGAEKGEGTKEPRGRTAPGALQRFGIDTIRSSASQKSEGKAPERKETSKAEISQEKAAKETDIDAGSNKPQEAPRKVKVNVNGRQVEVDEADLVRGYQKYAAADELFNNAAKQRQEIDRLLSGIKENPREFLSNPELGLDVESLAEEIFAEKIERELRPQESAEQKRIKELENELNSFKDKEKQAADEADKAEFTKIVQARREEISKTFQEALSMTELSKDPETNAEIVREMAMYMRLCRQAGYDPSPKDLAQHVEGRFMRSYSALVKNLDGEGLINLLGKDVVKKIRAWDIAQLEASRKPREPRQADDYDSTGYKTGRQFVSPTDLLRRRK